MSTLAPQTASQSTVCVDSCGLTDLNNAYTKYLSALHSLPELTLPSKKHKGDTLRTLTLMGLTSEPQVLGKRRSGCEQACSGIPQKGRFPTRAPLLVMRVRWGNLPVVRHPRSGMGIGIGGGQCDEHCW